MPQQPVTPPAADGSASLREVLASECLERYHDRLVENGYDMLSYLLTKMTTQELHEAAETVGMPNGHALRFVKLFSTGSSATPAASAAAMPAASAASAILMTPTSSVPSPRQCVPNESNERNERLEPSDGRFFAQASHSLEALSEAGAEAAADAALILEQRAASASGGIPHSLPSGWGEL